ncbi:MAG: hypothetical protein WB715_20525 [Roseiarcus sp.]|uniref:hypothetical protein n=1 Tax=Roseiarcus sp. TaxID=1969460 RepID=UPI003C4D6062
MSTDLDADNPNLLQVLVLERVDRAKDMARFYVLSIEPTLFEDLAHCQKALRSNFGFR